MSTAGSTVGLLGRRNIFDLSTDRVVAIARLALAVFGLVAIYLDPSQPASSAEIAYGVLATYLVFALTLAVAPLWAAMPPAARVVTHIIDIVTFSLVMHFTEGPTSPFFVLFTFALLSATLYWNWRGALVTTVVLALLLLAIAWSWGLVFTDAHIDIDDLVIRGSYLLIAGALLAYVGAYRDRTRMELAKLAAWPAEPMSSSDVPPLAHSLAHAAGVLRASRVVVLWEDAEEPYANVCVWSDGRLHHERLPAADVEGLLAPELALDSFLMEDAARNVIVTAAGSRRLAASPIAAALRERLGISGGLGTAAFHGAGFSGRLLVMSPVSPGDDVLSLIEIAALRIGIAIEHHRLRIELQRAAAAEERMRIARDVHDSTLQTLTAAALRLKNASGAMPDEQRGRLDEVRQILADQQRQLRAFVADALERESGRASVSLETELGRLLRDIERDWSCATTLAVEPATAVVSNGLWRQLALLVTEAAANAVRHGQAQRFMVAVVCSPTQLLLRIGNNGRPLDGLAGRFDHQELVQRKLGPASIRDRVAGLRGRMQLSSGAAGVELAIELPLP